MITRENMEALQVQLKRQMDERAVLERTKSDLQLQVEMLQENNVTAEVINKEREQLRQSKWKLEKDVEQLRSQLDSEKQTREILETTKVNIERELRTIHKTLEEDLARSLIESAGMQNVKYDLILLDPSLTMSSIPSIEISGEPWSRPVEAFQEAKKVYQTKVLTR
jgi:hypothetical protein